MRRRLLRCEMDGTCAHVKRTGEIASARLGFLDASVSECKSQPFTLKILKVTTNFLGAFHILQVETSRLISCILLLLSSSFHTI